MVNRIDVLQVALIFGWATGITALFRLSNVLDVAHLLWLDSWGALIVFGTMLPIIGIEMWLDGVQRN